MTIEDIIQKRCGGWQALARRCPVRPGVSAKTVWSWLQNGIPEKHWVWVMPIANVSEADLHAANESLRREVSRRRPLGRGRKAEPRASAA